MWEYAKQPWHTRLVTMASNDMKAYTLCSMNDLIEQGLMSHQTHYKSHWGRF